MKIGLITVYYSNYGSFFQTLALKRQIEQLGHECKVIHASIRGLKIYKFLIGMLGEKVIPQKIQEKIVQNNSEFRIYRSLVKDISELEVVDFFSSTKKLSKKYDCILIGSDELWSVGIPYMGYVPPYFGVGISAPLISYATSGVGMGKLSSNRKKEIGSALSNFCCLSVRDDVTKKKIESLRNEYPNICDPIKCIDPTLLNPCFLQPVEREEPYMLVYGIDFEQWQIDKIQQLAKEKSLKIIGISWKHDFFDEFGEITCAADFEKYFAKSSYCVVSTFHGTVFSILNHKPFLSFPSKARTDKIKDLLILLNLTDRFCMKETVISELPDIDYEQVEKQLHLLRQDSLNYLNYALACVEKKND